MSIFRSFVLADLITLANASCGMAAIFLCLNHVAGTHTPYLSIVFASFPLPWFSTFWTGLLRAACPGIHFSGLILIPWPILFPLALRLRYWGTHWAMRGVWDAVILIYFVLCGIGRFARFNVTAVALSDRTGKVRYYEGNAHPDQYHSCYHSWDLFFGWAVSTI